MQHGERFNPKGLFYGALIPNWLLRRRELNFGAKLVWGRLYQYCNEEGRAFPKIDTLAEELGSSASGIRKAISELEEAGLITVVDHFSTHQASDYYFVWHEWIEEGARPKRPDRELQSGGRGSYKVAGAGATKERARELQSSGLKRRESEEENQTKESAPEAPFQPESQPPPSVPATPEADSLRSSAPRGSQQDAERPCALRTLDPGNGAAADPQSTLEAPVPSDVAARTAEELARRAEAARKARLGSTLSTVTLKSREAHARSTARKQHAAERRRTSREDSFSEPEQNPRTFMFHVWCRELAANFADIPVPKKWSPREWGQAQHLLDKYEPVEVESAIVYTIRNWAMIVKRTWPKGNGPVFPTIALILSFSEKWVPEAAIWTKHRDVIAEYEQFASDSYTERPWELTKRYMAAMEDLKSLGLS